MKPAPSSSDDKRAADDLNNVAQIMSDSLRAENASLKDQVQMLQV